MELLDTSRGSAEGRCRRRSLGPPPLNKGDPAVSSSTPPVGLAARVLAAKGLSVATVTKDLAVRDLTVTGETRDLTVTMETKDLTAAAETRGLLVNMEARDLTVAAEAKDVAVGIVETRDSTMGIVDKESEIGDKDLEVALDSAVLADLAVSVGLGSTRDLRLANRGLRAPSADLVVRPARVLASHVDCTSCCTDR